MGNTTSRIERNLLALQPAVPEILRDFALVCGPAAARSFERVLLAHGWAKGGLGVEILLLSNRMSEPSAFASCFGTISE